MLFKLKTLQKIYKQRVVLDLDDLEIEKGCFYALTGANGSGKTTLLQILALIEYPDRGELIYQGEAVKFKERNLLPLRKNIALVDQHPVLFNMSVCQNVQLPLLFRGVAAAMAKEQALEMLTRVDMLSFAETNGQNLSGGEIQRIALARALVCNPKILLLDEPSSNIDKQHQTAIEELIREFAATAGASVILATHNLEQAQRLAKRRLHLSRGRLAQF